MHWKYERRRSGVEVITGAQGDGMTTTMMRATARIDDEINGETGEESRPLEAWVLPVGPARLYEHPLLYASTTLIPCNDVIHLADT